MLTNHRRLFSQACLVSMLFTLSGCRESPENNQATLVPATQAQAAAQPTGAVPFLTNDHSELVAVVEQVLERWSRQPEGSSVRAALLDEAWSALRPAFMDPLLADAEVWALAGRIAIARNDPVLAIFAYEALDRLHPQAQRPADIRDMLLSLPVLDAKAGLADIRNARDRRRGVYELARAGDLAAMHDLAGEFDALQDLGTVVPDLWISSQWYRAAAERGHAPSMRWWAIRKFGGWGVERDRVAAAEWFRQAALAGDHDAWLWLETYVYEREESVGGSNAVLKGGWGESAAESDRAAEYQKRLEAGDFAAGHQLALMRYYGRGVKRDSLAAAAWLRNRASQNDARAMYLLAHGYRYGNGLPHDLTESFKWYERAAKAGDSLAYYRLGTAYNFSHGTTYNAELAARNYRQAFVHDNSYSIVNLAVMVENGQVSGGVNLAHQLMIYATGFGNPTIMNNIGFDYRQGSSVRQDLHRAELWYLRAISLDDEGAMTNLGYLLWHGIGLPINRDFAARLWRRAANTGEEQAIINLNAEGLSRAGPSDLNVSFPSYLPGDTRRPGQYDSASKALSALMAELP